MFRVRSSDSFDMGGDISNFSFTTHPDANSHLDRGLRFAGIGFQNLSGKKRKDTPVPCIAVFLKKKKNYFFGTSPTTFPPAIKLN